MSTSFEIQKPRVMSYDIIKKKIFIKAKGIGLFCLGLIDLYVRPCNYYLFNFLCTMFCKAELIV